MTTIKEIYQCIDPFVDRQSISPSSDLNRDEGVTGDDFQVMMELYARTFHVDMSGYRWYFHSAEEGLGNFGAMFFRSPVQRVKYIAVTPEMLRLFADAGKWNLNYPPHTIPKFRIDLLINMIVLFLCIIFSVYCCRR